MGIQKGGKPYIGKQSCLGNKECSVIGFLGKKIILLTALFLVQFAFSNGK